ncbi:MAG: DUF3316 domain-containing protein [Muribaculaceae bacterium]|nr:DUF3316 domain-containing protein [Muribaculaceae bacterium]
MKLLTAILSAFALATALAAPADEPQSAEPQAAEQAPAPRPIHSEYSLEIGGAAKRATYLSPLSYSGAEFAVAGYWWKRLPFAPERAVMAFDARIAGSLRLLNPAQTASMQSIAAELAWNMSARWDFAQGWHIAVGGGPEVAAGAQAVMRNSNNPVAVDMSAALAATIEAGLATRVGRRPLDVTLRMRSPLAGAFFMPGYTETFYEIWLGNRSGLAHFGWPGNHQRLNAHLQATLSLGRYGLGVGYRLLADRFTANHLLTRSVTHAATLTLTH